jgi:transposase
VAALSGAAAAELAAQLHGRQVVITGGLIELVRRARLADHEQAAIAAAIAVLDRTHTGVPVLADLVQVLQDAPPQVRTAIWDRGDEQEYARLVDPLLRSLTALISGVFGEVFGGTGTGSGAGAGAVLALDAPAVGLDTSSTPTPMNGCRPRSCWPAGRTGSGRSWDRDGGHRLLALLRERFSTITLVWADSGYAGRLVIWARAVLRLSVTVIKRTDDVRGFVLVPRRWVVERTFGWLSRYRRLVRDYERRPEHHEAMVLWATTMIMVRQLAHQPAHPRWGGERSKPPHIQQAQRAA